MAVKVSVIVTDYNLGQYLTTALESVRLQTFEDWECIVVDDGSTDDSADIVNGFIATDHRFVSIKLENGGVVRARNEGIKASQGKYILPLDADDWIEPDYLEKAVRIIESDQEIKIVYGLAERFGAGVKPALMDVPDFSMEMMLAGNCIHVSSLFRREDFDRTGGYSADFSFGLEDWDFWLGVLDQGGKAVKIDEVMLHYRIRRSSRNKQISDTKLRRLRRLIWEHHKELFSQYFFDPVESQEYRRLNYSYNKVSKFPSVFLYNAWVRFKRGKR